MNPDVTIQFPDDVSVTEFNSLLADMEQGRAAIPAHKVFHASLRTDAREATSLANTLSATARVDGRLVAYLRLLTDQAYMYYILDIMVHPAWQRKQVGSALLDRVVEYAKEQGFIKVFLTAIPGTEAFYERFGFQPTMSTVMALRGEDYQGGGA